MSNGGVRSLCEVSSYYRHQLSLKHFIVIGVSSLSFRPTLVEACGCLTVWRVSPTTIAMLSALANP